jgi:hypothetical protein
MPAVDPEITVGYALQRDAIMRYNGEVLVDESEQIGVTLGQLAPHGLGRLIRHLPSAPESGGQIVLNLKQTKTAGLP